MRDAIDGRISCFVFPKRNLTKLTLMLTSQDMLWCWEKKPSGILISHSFAQNFPSIKRAGVFEGTSIHRFSVKERVLMLLGNQTCIARDISL